MSVLKLKKKKRKKKLKKKEKKKRNNMNYHKLRTLILHIFLEFWFLEILFQDNQLLNICLPFLISFLFFN